MTAIELESIIYPSIVTLMAAMQLVHFAKAVGMARTKYKVSYPHMTGNPNFERVLRAQQNSLEFFPIFMVSLWMSSLFFNQGISAAIGLVYVYSRMLYFKGYSQDVKDRLPGFTLGKYCMVSLAVLAGCGFVNTLLHMHMGIDLDIWLKGLFRT